MDAVFCLETLDVATSSCYVGSPGWDLAFRSLGTSIIVGIIYGVMVGLILMFINNKFNRYD